MRGKLALVLMGRAMLSKSLIQFSVDGWVWVPYLLFTSGQTMVEVMKIMVTSFRRSHACTGKLSAPNPTAGHHQPTPLTESPGHSQEVWVSLLWGHCSFFQVPGMQSFCLCPLIVYFLSPVQVLAALWWGQLQPPPRGLIPYPSLLHPESLPQWQATADPYLHRRHSEFCLSLCGVSGSWCTQGLFEPSESLWRVWGLILNVISPVLPSCWHFSFALGCGVSPQIHSSTMQLPLQRLLSCWGFSALGPGVSVPILYLPLEGDGD